MALVAEEEESCCWGVRAEAEDGRALLLLLLLVALVVEVPRGLFELVRDCLRTASLVEEALCSNSMGTALFCCCCCCCRLV